MSIPLVNKAGFLTPNSLMNEKRPQGTRAYIERALETGWIQSPNSTIDARVNRLLRTGYTITHSSGDPAVLAKLLYEVNPLEDPPLFGSAIAYKNIKTSQLFKIIHWLNPKNTSVAKDTMGRQGQVLDYIDITDYSRNEEHFQACKDQYEKTLKTAATFYQSEKGRLYLVCARSAESDNDASLPKTSKLLQALPEGVSGHFSQFCTVADLINLSVTSRLFHSEKMREHFFKEKEGVLHFIKMAPLLFYAPYSVNELDEQNLLKLMEPFINKNLRSFGDFGEFSESLLKRMSKTYQKSMGGMSVSAVSAIFQFLTKNCPLIEKVHLSYTKFHRPVSLSGWKLPNLRELHLQHAASLGFTRGLSLTDQQCKQLIEGCPKLEKLNITGVGCPRTMLQEIAKKHTGLKELTLQAADSPLFSEFEFDFGSMAQNNPELTSLNLPDWSFSGEALNTLNKLTHLTTLDLSAHTGLFSDEFIAKLSNLTRLQYLDLSGQVRIIGNSFSGLPPSLRALRLAGCEDLDCANLRHLSHLMQLEELDISGFAEPISANYIKLLPNSLKKLRCESEDVSAEDEAVLRQERPLIKLIFVDLEAATPAGS